jgi:hypothetical protein
MGITRLKLRGGRRALRLVLLAVPFVLCSCGGGGPNLYPVHGQVLYEGRPANGAIVFFHPQGAPAPTATDESQGGRISVADMPIGKVGPDGSFELTTSNRGHGAPAGRYAVTVLWTAPAPANAGDADGPSYLPARYGVPTYSGLVAEVKEGDNHLPPMQLTR